MRSQEAQRFIHHVPWEHLWLRHWYQTGGSDRMPLVRHWKFLKWLVMAGMLEA
jgi:hypothetical protein